MPAFDLWVRHSEKLSREKDRKFTLKIAQDSCIRCQLQVTYFNFDWTRFG